MTALRYIAALVCLPAAALVSTNLDAITTLPSPVGWNVVSDTGEGCAISSNVWVTVNHVPMRGLSWGGVWHSAVGSVVPPGADIRFTFTDTPFTSWAHVYLPTNAYPYLEDVVVIGGGVGTGKVQYPNYWWNIDNSTRMKRWGRSGSCYFIQGMFAWRSDECGASSGDSGGAVFTGDGHYVGPIGFGGDPMTVGTYGSGGVPAYQFLSSIPGHLPPKPRKPGSLSAIPL